MRTVRMVALPAAALLIGVLYASVTVARDAPHAKRIALGQAQYACTTSNPAVRCGPYDYPLVEGASSNPYVDQNVWGPISGESQTLRANSPGDWQVTSTTPVGNTAVTAFPNTGAAFGEQPLSAFPEIIGSFSETMPHTAGSSAWATYDNWFDNWKYEVMIQHDFVGNGPCDYHAVATFGGSNGVPSQLWGLCTYGSELIWKLAAPGSTVGDSGTVNESSGSVDIKAMITWLVDHGYMAPDPTITNLSYGWEICSTGGNAQNFAVTSYSLTTQPSAGQQPPAVTTGSASNVTSSGATVHATVNPAGAGTAYQFDYGRTTHYRRTTATASAGSSASDVSVSAGITGLHAGTTYHYRIEATNTYGTSYGSDATFTTSSTPGGSLLVGDNTLQTALDGTPAGQAEAFSYMAVASGTSVSASFYVDPSNRATSGRLGVYTDSGWDSPGERLAQAGFTPTPGWNNVTLSGASIVAGRTYWLAALGTGGQLAFRDQGFGSKDELSAQPRSRWLPKSWSDGTAWNSGHASFYISG